MGHHNFSSPDAVYFFHQDFNGIANITVKSGGSLVIINDTTLNSGSTITIEDGGNLTNHASLYVDTGAAVSVDRGGTIQNGNRIRISGTIQNDGYILNGFDDSLNGQTLGSIAVYSSHGIDNTGIIDTTDGYIQTTNNNDIDNTSGIGTITGINDTRSTAVSSVDAEGNTTEDPLSGYIFGTDYP